MHLLLSILRVQRIFLMLCFRFFCCYRCADSVFFIGANDWWFLCGKIVKWSTSLYRSYINIMDQQSPSSWSGCLSMLLCLCMYCIKYHNFTLRSSVETFWKRTASVKSLANHSKLCRNCAFPQNFHTRKLGEILVFYAVMLPISITYVLKWIFFQWSTKNSM